MADELQAQKDRYADLGKQRQKLEAQIEKEQEPLLKDRFAKDRPRRVERLRQLKEGMVPIAKEMSALARALNGKM